MSAPQNCVLKLTGHEFFDKLQETIGTDISPLIRNVLLINGVDRAVILSRFEKDSVTKIENFMKHDFTRDMVPKCERKENYLGNYVKHQDKFVLSLGQKLIIDLMVETCRKYTKSNGISTDTESSQLPNDQMVESNAAASSSTDAYKEKYETVKQRMGQDEVDFAKYIGSLLITIFNDAKRLTISSFSWPSRHVAAEKSYQYRAFGDPVCSNPTLNYVTPTQHKDFLNCIVESDLEKFKDRLENSLALSVRVDGSVDRTQDHNVYVMGHLVNKDTTVSLVFIGFDVPKQGLHVRLLSEIKNLISGDKSLISIWCSAHRINLAWKDVCDEFTIIAQIVADASSLSSYFHKSGERTAKLKRGAATAKLPKPLRYVTHFLVRWTEYIFELLYVTLRNWRASMNYFVNEEETGLEHRWLHWDRLHLTVFLTDILQIFKTFQKKFESDTITLLDVQKNKQKLYDELEQCLQGPVDNGWEELFLEIVDGEDGISFWGYELSYNTGRSTTLATLVFNTEIRKSIIRSIMKHVDKRLEYDAQLQDHLKPLAHISSTTTAQSLKLCYNAIIPDLDECQFYVEYKSATILLKNREVKSPLDNLQMLQTLRPNDFPVLKIALARVIAAKPHSADVERLICNYNKIKAIDRTAVSGISLYNFLHIKVNMPSLDEFDPGDAVQHWTRQKNRRPAESQTRKQQEFFKGVFAVADQHKPPKNPRIVSF